MIKLHIASEHAVLKSATLFLGLCTAFSLIVGAMSLGRYGYLPSPSFFWAPILLILTWPLNIQLISDEGVWRYQVRWWRWTVSAFTVKAWRWKEVGKIMTLEIKTSDKWRSTFFSVDKSSAKCQWLNTLLFS